MKQILIADKNNIDDITRLRVFMQLEDWKRTLNTDYTQYSEKFGKITKKYLIHNLNKSIFFALMYIDGEAVSMCAVEEVEQLPQITVCAGDRHCNVVSVYTIPKYRGNGFGQKLIAYLLRFAKEKGFNDITLTTNAPDAAHIYEKIGFRKISDKYFLG